MRTLFFIMTTGWLLSMGIDAAADETDSKGEASETAGSETTARAQAKADDLGYQEPVLGPTKPIWTWVAFGVGGVAAVTGGILGGVALSKKNDFMDDCGDDDCPLDRRDDQTTINNMAIMADIMFTVAIAGATTGLVLLLFNRCFDVESESLALSTSVSSNGAGFALVGRF